MSVAAISTQAFNEVPKHRPILQSQGMRVIEASTDQFNLTGAQRSLYQKVDGLIGEKEKEERDYGIAWTTHDAFSNLLQVRSGHWFGVFCPRRC